MPDLDQILQKIDYWCQWDETFKEDADSLRQFFQARRDLFSAIFAHFLAVDPKRSKPTDIWWRQWKNLRADLPDGLARSLLLGLARRNEWYRCLSNPPFQWHPELAGFECKTASDDDGYFTFELFFDAEHQLRFARAHGPQQRYGAEHVCGPIFRFPNQRAMAHTEYTSDSTVYAWNEQVRWATVWVPAGSPDTLIHPHASWIGEPPSQFVQRYSSWYEPHACCYYVSCKSHDLWYDRLPVEEASRTHVISQGACWALSEFIDQEVHTTLRDIVLTYAGKKPGTFPAAPFPSISVVLPEALRANGFDENLCRYSQVELMTRYPEHELFQAQVFANFSWACRWQHQMSQLVDQSKNSTYQRAASAVWALSQMADDSSIVSLNHILGRTLDKRFQKLLRTTLDALAAGRGLSREELADRLVPTHDLDASGRQTWQLGEYHVCISITAAGKVQRIITDANGKESKNLPAKIRKEYDEIWRSIQAAEKALVATFSQQKKRLEEAMVAGRSWPYEHWRDLFTTHPLLSHLAQRLIWNVCAPDGTSLFFALPGDDGAWCGSNQETVQIEEQSLLRLAHPVEMTSEEHAAWQQLIVTQHIVQPFKQAFREIYVLTPAEEETARYSNRFAGQRVPSKTFHGVARGRGWTGDMLHNSEGEGKGWRNFPERDVCASFLLDDDTVRDDTVGNDWTRTLGQVSFFPAGARPNQFALPFDLALPLPEVHPVVFSEAMRDLDLFVAVASIGIDLQWQDQEPERQRREYLSQEQAKMRAELLRALLPILGVADRVRIEEDAALVSGNRADYRVHLSSGTIYLQPAGQYLCIVPRAPEGLYLPFEEDDTRTAEILSKILLLVQDEQITDPTILRQIPSRREVR